MARDVQLRSGTSGIPNSGGSTQAWGRPLSTANSTEGSTASNSLGALGLSSLQLDNDDDDGSVDEANRKEVSDLIRKRIATCRKQKKSVFKQLGLRGKLSLNLSNVDLTSLDEKDVEDMIAIGMEKINLSKNKSLVVVPELLVKGAGGRHLATLQHLDLSHCHIQLMSREWNLPNLLSLDLSHNRLKDFPSKAVIQGLPLLKTLDLYGNRIMTLPDFCCPNQQKSSAGGGVCVKPCCSNESEASMVVPVVIEATTTAAPLSSSFRSSRRSSFKDAIAATASTNSVSACKAESWNQSGLLEHLTTLNVGYNDLTGLPHGLPPSLRILIVCNNFLSCVPEPLVMGSVAEETLKELDVSSNPISCPPPEVCESGLRTMRRWFREHGSASSNVTGDDASAPVSQRTFNNNNKREQRRSLRIQTSSSSSLPAAAARRPPEVNHDMANLLGGFQVT